MLGYYLTNKKVTFNWKNTKPTEIEKAAYRRRRRRKGAGEEENKVLCISA